MFFQLRVVSYAHIHGSEEPRLSAWRCSEVNCRMVWVPTSRSWESRRGLRWRMRNSPDGLAHRLDTFQLFSSYSTRSTHEATRKQGRCPPERVFAVVARAGEEGLVDARGTRDRLRPLQPSGQGFPHRRHTHIQKLTEN